MSATRSVLVTDGEQRAALAIVRSLGAAGYRCGVGSRSGKSIAGCSRFAAWEVALPDPAQAPQAFTAAVENVVLDRGIDMLLPVSEASLLAVLPRRDQLPTQVPFAGIDVFRAVCDKALVLETARRLGIRVPAQREIKSPSDASALEPTLPLVLKPHASVVSDGNGGRTRVGVRWAHTPREFYSALSDYPLSAYPVLAQEVISGPGIGVFVLMDRGKVVASYAHRRLREKPPSGGVSVVCQSEPMDPVLLEKTVRLLRHFSWTGPAMVEYKRDMGTGEPVMMEINGRFWGSLQLAIDAGVDFPRLLAARSFGEPMVASGSYALVRSRWFWGDVDHLLARWREPHAGLRGRAAALTAWVGGFSPRYRSEMFRMRDPGPFWRETVSWLTHLIHRP